MINSLIEPRARLGLGTVLLALVSLVATARSEDRPLPGQVLIDPEHPAWLIRHPVKNRDKPQHIFLCGPGDPEDFLYRGQRRTDGTRDGDQEQIIRKLIQHGGNCLYLQAVRSHGGDGQRDHNPFVDSDPTKGLDRDILDQWDGWFRLMDQHGIVIYLFLYDDSARIWGRKTDKQLPPEERAFLTAIVDRFEKHANLIWVVAEECEEAFSMEWVRAMAEVISAADDHNHIIGTHHQSGTSFKAWQPGGALSHFSMQYNKPGDAAHAGAVEAFRKARGNYQVIYAENTAREADVKQAWASAMGGLMPMLLGLDVANTPAKTLNPCRYLSRFFEATDFYRMEPHDELVHHGTEWLLADEGQSYIAYAEAGNEPLGIKHLPAGCYELTWLDCENGRSIQETATVKQANHTFARPTGIGGWCAVWVWRTDRDKNVGKPDSQPSDSMSHTVFPDRFWENQQPSEVGLDAKPLDEFVKAVGGDGVIIKGGYLVKSWGKADRRGDWASAAKPVLSTLLFFAIEEGKLKSVDDPVRPWVQKRWPGKDLIPKDRGMTFRQLADMTSGYARAEKPGTHWAYNDCAISLYRHVLEEVLGESLVKAARQRFEPLQFEDGDLFGSRGGGGVNASPRDFARVGWLWLNHGNWAGKQLLPKTYFEKHLRPDVPTDLPRTKGQGEDYLKVGTYGGGSDQNFPVPGVYGFNWWFNERPNTDGPRFAPHLPADAFWALGHEGREVLLVLPSHKIVVAARGNWGGASLPKRSCCPSVSPRTWDRLAIGKHIPQSSEVSQRMDLKAFQDALRERFYPVLRGEGFRGSGSTLRRINGSVVHVFNVQGSSGGGRCYLNLGAHLSFLPTAGKTMPELRKIKEYECAFRDRLPPPNDFCWQYGNDTQELKASLNGVIECWSTYGRSFFDRYASYPESFVSLLDELDPSVVHPSHLLTFARIASHLGDSARASSLATEGIRRCPVRATALLENLQAFA